MSQRRQESFSDAEENAFFANAALTQEKLEGAVFKVLQKQRAKLCKKNGGHFFSDMEPDPERPGKTLRYHCIVCRVFSD